MSDDHVAPFPARSEPVDRGDAIQAALNEERARPGQAIVATRQATHGRFADTARVRYRILKVVNEEIGTCGTDPGALGPVVDMAVDFIVSKLARAIAGNPLHPDHWADIAGYAEGVAGEIRKLNGEG